MSRLYYGLIFFIAITLTVSCGLIEFDFSTSAKGKIKKPDFCPPQTGVFEIPQAFKEHLTSQLNDVISNSFDDIIAEVKKQDTWPADEIILTKLSMEQTSIPSSPASYSTLGFISELKIYISLDDGSDEFLFASVKNSDDKARKLVFDVADKTKNIINYIDKGFKIRIDSKLRDCPSEDIAFKNNLTVHIKL